MEYKAGVDSGVCVLAKRGGVVKSVSANLVRVTADNGDIDDYQIIKFMRSNQKHLHQPGAPWSAWATVWRRTMSSPTAPAIKNGEISLGKNALIGFMTWEGYNYEDAVLLNEKIVRNDMYTSIHIEEYEMEARDTKLGAGGNHPGYPQRQRGASERPGRPGHHPRGRRCPRR